MKKKYLPIKEIHFAAKSGFLTKELWLDFFAYGCRAWRFRLWKQFIDDGVLIEHHSKNAKDIWVLNRRNLLVQRTIGSHIAHAPFISQITHDEMIARIVLNIMKDGAGLFYRLEPELKKMTPGIKGPADSNNRLKFPDGLIQLKNADKSRVALELELTAKDPKRYRRILQAYASFQKADMIVFIVREDRLIKTIRKAMHDTFYPTWEKPIGFGHLNDWLSNPTTAKISFTDQVTTIAEMVTPEPRLSA